MEQSSHPVPRWSVVIPAFRRTAYLESAIRSVLVQRGSAEHMEIVVVDNASETSEIEDLVKRVGGGEVHFVRNECNLGAVGNWNRCVELARGELVHLLHDDDRVLPGFYEAMDRIMLDHPAAGMAVGSAWFIDKYGKRMPGQQGVKVPAGVWKEFALIAADRNPVVCPGVVVRRKAFQAVGPFRTDLELIPDWEMWCRIGEKYPVVAVPTPLAEYRIHAQSNYDAGKHGLKWCREIRDLILELHCRQNLRRRPSFGFVLVWGGKAVWAMREAGNSRLAATGVAWRVFLLVPNAVSARWLIRQCWTLFTQAKA